jgi:inorganic pyrophosphatase
MNKAIIIQKGAIFSIVLFCFSCTIDTPNNQNDFSRISYSEDSLSLKGPSHFISGYKPILNSEWVQMVVEIPTGTTAKWEVNKITGGMRWEIRKGVPRKVKYLGYPGNYGMIPQTLLDKRDGGDGDPLDILCIGDPLPRGSVVPVRLIGVLKLLDAGEKDNKLIAVPQSSAFDNVKTIKNLDQEFEGVTEIIETWFLNYKGPGEMKSLGFAEKQEALRILNLSMEAYIER